MTMSLTNRLCFKKTKKKILLQVIPMVTHWIRICSYLQKEEQREAMDCGVEPFGDRRSDLFNQCGGRLNNRINS
jgi:hypothetical protein